MKITEQTAEELRGYGESELASMLGVKRQVVHNWTSPSSKQYRGASKHSVNMIANFLNKPCYEICECASDNCK